MFKAMSVLLEIWFTFTIGGKYSPFLWIFAKIDLLPIDNDSEKKKQQKLKNKINHFKFLETYW